jgi:hypothetical protein
MKKKTKILIGILIVLIHPFGRNDISHDVPMPDTVLKIIKNSCFDCHSNQTAYPWYAEINPFGWWLSHHVNEGKSELNFSEFVSYNSSKKLKKLEEIADEVKEHKMPLDSYVLIHKNAKLTQQQISTLVNWSVFARKELQNKVE